MTDITIENYKQLKPGQTILNTYNNRKHVVKYAGPYPSRDSITTDVIHTEDNKTFYPRLVKLKLVDGELSEPGF